jgi:hypothetical protein
MLHSPRRTSPVARRWSLPLASVVASAVLLVLPIGANAQSAVSGSWNVEFPRRVENDGSGERVTEYGHALLVLEIKGDSVIGTWKSLDPGPNAAVSRRLAGTSSGGKLRLVSEPFEAVMRSPDGESRVKLVGTYDLEIQGDALTGTQQMSPQDGGQQGPSLPVKGTRSKA